MFGSTCVLLHCKKTLFCSSHAAEHPLHHISEVLVHKCAQHHWSPSALDRIGRLPHGLARCLLYNQAGADVQGSKENQDAACSAGALGPLLDIVAAGPDQLAAKSAALAVSALTTNHTANQDALR